MQKSSQKKKKIKKFSLKKKILKFIEKYIIDFYFNLRAKRYPRRLYRFIVFKIKKTIKSVKKFFSPFRFILDKKDRQVIKVLRLLFRIRAVRKQAIKDLFFFWLEKEGYNRLPILIYKVYMRYIYVKDLMIKAYRRWLANRGVPRLADFIADLILLPIALYFRLLFYIDTMSRHTDKYMHFHPDYRYFRNMGYARDILQIYHTIVKLTDGRENNFKIWITSSDNIFFLIGDVIFDTILAVTKYPRLLFFYIFNRVIVMPVYLFTVYIAPPIFKYALKPFVLYLLDAFGETYRFFRNYLFIIRVLVIRRLYRLLKRAAIDFFFGTLWLYIYFFCLVEGVLLILKFFLTIVPIVYLMYFLVFYYFIYEILLYFKILYKKREIMRKKEMWVEFLEYKKFYIEYENYEKIQEAWEDDQISKYWLWWRSNIIFFLINKYNSFIESIGDIIFSIIERIEDFFHSKLSSVYLKDLIFKLKKIFFNFYLKFYSLITTLRGELLPILLLNKNILKKKLKEIKKKYPKGYKYLNNAYQKIITNVIIVDIYINAYSIIKWISLFFTYIVFVMIFFMTERFSFEINFNIYTYCFIAFLFILILLNLLKSLFFSNRLVFLIKIANAFVYVYLLKCSSIIIFSYLISLIDFSSFIWKDHLGSFFSNSLIVYVKWDDESLRDFIIQYYVGNHFPEELVRECKALGTEYDAEFIKRICLYGLLSYQNEFFGMTRNEMSEIIRLSNGSSVRLRDLLDSYTYNCFFRYVNLLKKFELSESEFWIFKPMKYIFTLTALNRFFDYKDYDFEINLLKVFNLLPTMPKTINIFGYDILTYKQEFKNFIFGKNEDFKHISGYEYMLEYYMYFFREYIIKGAIFKFIVAFLISIDFVGIDEMRYFYYDPTRHSINNESFIYKLDAESSRLTYKYWWRLFPIDCVLSLWDTYIDKTNRAVKLCHPYRFSAPLDDRHFTDNEIAKNPILNFVYSNQRRNVFTEERSYYFRDWERREKWPLGQVECHIDGHFIPFSEILSRADPDSDIFKVTMATYLQYHPEDSSFYYTNPSSDAYVDKYNTFWYKYIAPWRVYQDFMFETYYRPAVFYHYYLEEVKGDIAKDNGMKYRFDFENAPYTEPLGNSEWNKIFGIDSNLLQTLPSDLNVDLSEGILSIPPGLLDQLSQLNVDLSEGVRAISSDPNVSRAAGRAAERSLGLPIALLEQLSDLNLGRSTVIRTVPSDLNVDRSAGLRSLPSDPNVDRSAGLSLGLPSGLTLDQLSHLNVDLSPGLTLDQLLDRNVDLRFDPPAIKLPPVDPPPAIKRPAVVVFPPEGRPENITIDPYRARPVFGGHDICMPDEVESAYQDFVYLENILVHEQLLETVND